MNASVAKKTTIASATETTSSPSSSSSYSFPFSASPSSFSSSPPSSPPSSFPPYIPSPLSPSFTAPPVPPLPPPVTESVASSRSLSVRETDSIIIFKVALSSPASSLPFPSGNLVVASSTSSHLPDPTVDLESQTPSPSSPLSPCIPDLVSTSSGSYHHNHQHQRHHSHSSFCWTSPPCSVRTSSFLPFTHLDSEAQFSPENSPVSPSSTSPFTSASFPRFCSNSVLIGSREMRRHCPTMPPTSHHSGSSNIFSGLDSASADLHDLSRNHGNLKPEMSSMYHHHMMQSRQHHPSEMHDFLSGDPMSSSLPVALAAAANASNDQHQSSSNQLHNSGLYVSHGHHGNMNGMNTKLQVESDGPGVHCSYEPFLVNGMIPGLHAHHAAAAASSISAQAAAHQMQTFHHHSHHPSHHSGHHHPGFSSSPPSHINPNDPNIIMDADPRELEAFAEKFKQRRIKLGVTQADVGRALANLKLPGVGSLSQSTICRFESLTLSHNNMVALKPILQAWLEAAEAQARKTRAGGRGDSLDMANVLPNSDKKRKRTSIAAPEKRSLEAYFAVQPRPSGEKIAGIADKLDLKKNVVRVWFCNQRQKQKRMKYSAVNQPNIG